MGEDLGLHPVQAELVEGDLQGLPDGGARLVEVANGAFTAGMDLVAGIGIGVAAVTLLLAWRGLRSEARVERAVED